jgi:hypothetical protein
MHTVPVVRHLAAHKPLHAIRLRKKYILRAQIRGSKDVLNVTIFVGRWRIISGIKHGFSVLFDVKMCHHKQKVY